MEPHHPFADKISNEATALLPAIEYPGPICVVDTEAAVEAAVGELRRAPVIGFDTETRPSFRAGVIFRVALLQLATPERVFLFRLNRIALPRPLLALREDPASKKVGVAVDGDLRALHKLRRFREQGFVELQQLAPQWGIEEKSLRKLSAIVLQQRVSKAQRLSNWEAQSLTPKQALYAATDAWVCLRIYEELMHTPKIAKAAASIAAPTVCRTAKG